MRIAHELREEYRIYRIENPRLRLLFLLGDISILLIKLALFCGFIFLCWYILSRSPYSEKIARAPGNVLAATEASETDTPELTAERIALLRQIADQEVSSGVPVGGLIGKATVEDQAEADITLDEGFILASSDNQSIKTLVQVETVVDTVEYSLNQENLPTESGNPAVAESTVSQFSDEVFVPVNAENGSWILNQNPAEYTLQLALTSNVQFLVDFARQLPDEYTTAIYPERRTGRGTIQYSLSAGNFSAKRSGLAALESLSEQTKRFGAHVRRFDEIQANTSRFLK